MRLPRWCSGKNLPANAGDVGLIPGRGEIPGRRKCQSTQVFLPGKPHEQRSLVGYSPCVWKSLSKHTHLLGDVVNDSKSSSGELKMFYFVTNCFRNGSGNIIPTYIFQYVLYILIYMYMIYIYMYIYHTVVRITGMNWNLSSIEFEWL